MPKFSLNHTEIDSNLLFRDAASCSIWLEQLQLTNLHQAHSLLLTQISKFNHYSMQGEERFKILELLRETVSYVQEDYARKIISKPLPLNDTELMIFVALAHLWKLMTQGYKRCLQDYVDIDMQNQKHGALLYQRCLLYSGLELFTHLRSGYEFDSNLWRQLNELYAFAEKHNFHDIEVSDPLNYTYSQSSCRCVYVKILLACYARPADLSRSQLHMMNFWLTKWSSLVTVERYHTGGNGKVPALAIDLASSHGLLPSIQTRQSSTVRYLGMIPLSNLLRDKINLLQQGIPPLQADLCDNCSSQDCIELLDFLNRFFCKNIPMRFSERQPVTQKAQLCYKFENIYAHISGRAFQQPSQDDSLSDAERKQIEVFGRVLHDSRGSKLQESGCFLESWQFENENISGARLIRENGFAGRLYNKQLIALLPGDAKKFMLGVSVWVNVTRTGQLRAGIRYLPGAIEAVRIKLTSINLNIKENYAAAFLLSEVAMLNSPPSLVIRRDLLQTSRLVEVLHLDGKVDQIKTGFLVERGIDYERFSFTKLGS